MSEGLLPDGGHEGPTYRIFGSQNLSRMCVVCGVDNPYGLRGRFFVTEAGELLGVFRTRAEHQSYPGRLHGGLVSAILDETIGRAINLGDSGVWGVTVEFKVRFRRPVPLDRQVVAVGRITHDRGRVFEGSGEILLEDGAVAAEGFGRYLKLPLEEIVSSGFLDSDWFSDPFPAPSEISLKRLAGQDTSDQLEA